MGRRGFRHQPVRHGKHSRLCVAGNTCLICAPFVKQVLDAEVEKEEEQGGKKEEAYPEDEEEEVEERMTSDSEKDEELCDDEIYDLFDDLEQTDLMVSVCLLYAAELYLNSVLFVM